MGEIEGERLGFDEKENEPQIAQIFVVVKNVLSLPGNLLIPQNWRVMSFQQVWYVTRDT